MEQHRVVIIGGGISGLSCAYYLREMARAQSLDISLKVLESGDRPGGKIGTLEIDGFRVESAANGFLDSKPATRQLSTEIGLAPDLIRANPSAKKRFIHHEGKLHPVPTGPLSLASSKLLSVRGKLRLLREFRIPRRSTDEEESVAQFASRRIGDEAASVMVDAMVAGIHGGSPDELSVAAAFPRMVELEREHGSLFRAMMQISKQKKLARKASTTSKDPNELSSGPTLWSFRDGMGQLTGKLASILEENIEIRQQVSRLRKTTGHWHVQTQNQELNADVVVLCCPPHKQAGLTEGIDSQLSRLISEIPTNAISVIALGYEAEQLPHELDGFGYLTPQRLGNPILGVLWSSAIFENRAPDDMVLLQAMVGGWTRRDAASWDDAKLLQTVGNELKSTMGITRPACFSHIVRWPKAIPQYVLGHQDRVEQIDQRLQAHCGLVLSGNSYRGVAINDCILEAQRCSTHVMSLVRSRTPT